MSVSRVYLLRALRHRQFAFVWSGQLLSRLGDFLYDIALAWYVLQTTGSAASMALVLICGFLPTLLFTLPGGIAADRWAIRPILITADLARALIVCLVAVLAGRDQLALWHLYALSALFGTADAFFQPAYAALLPRLVADDDLASANALSSFTIQLGRIAGPPLGAAIVALMGLEMAFVLNGVTFLVAAVLLLPLGRIPPLTEEPEPVGLALTNSIRLVTAQPWLWRTIVVITLTNIALAGPYSVALPFLVNDHLGADVNVLGWLYGLFAAGYVIGGAWIGRQRRRRHVRRNVLGGVALASVALALFGLPIGLPALAVAALVNGAALEISSLSWLHLLQDRIPRAALGRVMAVDMVGSFALLPLGYAVAGWATDWLGAPLLLALSGGLMALVALAAWRHPYSRALDALPAAPEPAIQPAGRAGA